jgi:hypothetical protein
MYAFDYSLKWTQLMDERGYNNNALRWMKTWMNMDPLLLKQGLFYKQQGVKKWCIGDMWDKDRYFEDLPSFLTQGKP